MEQTAQQEPKKCRYCGKAITELTRREIFYRGYDHTRRKQVAKREHMDFCSPECASSYQMGCEG